MGRIKLAIAGVGNCASSLLQGISYYQAADSSESAGVLHPEIGGYGIGDLEPVAAFDVDRRKVGQPLEKAIFAPPNCTAVFHRELPSYGVEVQMAPALDGVAEHMRDYPEEQAFRVADAEPCDVAQVLRESGAEVLVSYMPVGAEDAVRHYARGVSGRGGWDGELRTGVHRVASGVVGGVSGAEPPSGGGRHQEPVRGDHHSPDADAADRR